MALPTDATERKNIPIYSGFICYFPDAIAEVAILSKAGNDQHNPGSPLHWDRSKSGDERDAMMRHVLDGAHVFAPDVEAAILAARAVAWRAMADLQKLCETRDEDKVAYTARYSASYDLWLIEVVGTNEVVMSINRQTVATQEEALEFFLNELDKSERSYDDDAPTDEEEATYNAMKNAVRGYN